MVGIVHSTLLLFVPEVLLLHSAQLAVIVARKQGKLVCQWVVVVVVMATKNDKDKNTATL